MQPPELSRTIHEVKSLTRSLPCESNPAERIYCSRWLYVVGLCLFIALSAYAHQDESGTLNPGVQERQEGETHAATTGSKPSYYKTIREASLKHALDPRLIATIIYVESGGDRTAFSPRGAKGLMQLTPVVYRQYGVDDPFDIEQNIRGGTAYFAYLLDRFDGNLPHALAAYNCGPTRVTEYKGIPPIRETRDYVKRVLDFYRKEEFPGGL
jgi:soluble lytic murein transglycosylase-like protein